MSEQSMGAEMGSPRDRAIAYLELRQHGTYKGGAEKNVKTGLMPDKVRRTEPLVDSVTAYEQVIDRMGKKGFEGSQQALENLRPQAYDTMRGVQWGARAVDFLLTAAIWLPPTNRIVRGLAPKAVATWAMMRFRPVEWAAAQGAKMAGAVATTETVAPIVNKILQGGERVPKTPAVPKPMAA